MDIDHTILGRPWLLDLGVTIYKCTNQCLFDHKSMKVKLISNQPKPPTPGKKVDKGKEKMIALAPEKKIDKGKGKMVMNLISLNQIERSLNEGLTCYALGAREAKPETETKIS